MSSDNVLGMLCNYVSTPAMATASYLCGGSQGFPLAPLPEPSGYDTDITDSISGPRLTLILLAFRTANRHSHSACRSQCSSVL